MRRLYFSCGKACKIKVTHLVSLEYTWYVGAVKKGKNAVRFCFILQLKAYTQSSMSVIQRLLQQSLNLLLEKRSLLLDSCKDPTLQQNWTKHSSPILCTDFLAPFLCPGHPIFLRCPSLISAYLLSYPSFKSCSKF